MKDKLIHIASLNSTQKACFYSVNLSDRHASRIGRNIFAGKYLFRGRLIEALIMELENANQVKKRVSIFLSKNNLENIFEQLQFGNHITSTETIGIINKKHLVVLAFLGYLTQKKDENSELLFDWIISNITEKKNYTYFRSMHDIWQKVKYLTKKHFNYDAFVSTVKQGANYRTVVKLNTNDIFESEMSSFKASRKNAFKMSIDFLLDLEKTKIEEYEKNRKLAQQKLKEESLNELKKEKYHNHLKYIKQREQKRLKRKKKFREKEDIKQKYRLKSKSRKSKNKKLAKLNRELFDKMLKNISSSKRRIMEDRGILPKER